MDNNEKKSESKCIKCQFFDKTNDSCPIKIIAQYDKKDVENCTDFIVRENLVMF